MFQVLKDGLSGDPQVFPYPSDLSKHIDNPHKPWFVSLYQYDQDQALQIAQVNSFRGIQDTTTEKLFFDLDSTSDLNKAKNQTAQLIERLINDGFELQNLQVYFSGKKGFSIEIDLLERLTPAQVKNIIKSLSKEFSCLDVKVTDPVRIIRVPNTKHDSGLYKIPLDPDEILNLSIEQIKELAKAPRALSLDYARAKLPETFKKLLTDNTKKPKLKVAELVDPIDFKNKPKEWRNCKWSLLQGNFKSGERHQAMTIIAATSRGLGYDRESAYYLCKSAIKKQARFTNQEEFSTDEVWENILQSIYAHDWKGGQYSCKSDPWLQNYCDGLDEHTCKDRNNISLYYTIDDLHNDFLNYTKKLKDNFINFNIAPLDKHAKLFSPSVVGFLGAPGSGKTSLAISFLREVASSGTPCMFFSLEMAKPVIFAKLIQTKLNITFEKAMEIYETPTEKNTSTAQSILRENKNIVYNFSTGINPTEIRNIIENYKENTGRYPKFIAIDYLELLSDEKLSDIATSSGVITGKLKALANEFNICILLLLQTQKHSTQEVSDPLLSLRQIKGSSLIEQNCDKILTIWREGYNVDTIQQDNYASIAIVKNRFGALWRGDFKWDGISGTIRELTSEEEFQLDEFREEKKARKAAKNKEQDNGFFS